MPLSKEALKKAINSLPTWVRANKFGKSDLSWKDKPWEEAIKDPVEECSISEANLILSEVEPDSHYVMLDLDIEAQLIPSTSPGHSHLYINRQLSWDQYKELLTALANAGIITNGYKEASFAKGATALRVPWVKKEPGDMTSDGTQQFVQGGVIGGWKTVSYLSDGQSIAIASPDPGPFSIGEEKPQPTFTTEELKAKLNAINEAKESAKETDNPLAEWEKELLGLMEEETNDGEN